MMLDLMSKKFKKLFFIVFIALVYIFAYGIMVKYLKFSKKSANFGNKLMHLGQKKLVQHI